MTDYTIDKDSITITENTFNGSVGSHHVKYGYNGNIYDENGDIVNIDYEVEECIRYFNVTPPPIGI